MNAAILALACSLLLAPPIETSPKPSTRLYVHTDPPGASVKLDGRLVGKSNDLFLVPPGVSKMTVEVELDAHDPQRKEVEIRGGQITRVELTLPRRPAASTAAGPQPPEPQVLLCYEFDPPLAPGEKPIDMDQVVATVLKRINPLGSLDITVGPRRAALWNDVKNDGIRISVARSQADRVERLLGVTGTLEFRIVANRKDHKPLIETADRNAAEAQRQQRPLPTEVRDNHNKLLGWWMPLAESMQPAGAGKQPMYPWLVCRTIQQDGKQLTQALVVNDTFNVTGQYIAYAAARPDDRGNPELELAFTAEGGRRLGTLTGSNLSDMANDTRRSLGIIFAGRLYSAPLLVSAIYSRARITGNFTRQEVEDLAALLSAGPLPVKLKLVQKQVYQKQPPAVPPAAR